MTSILLVGFFTVLNWEKGKTEPPPEVHAEDCKLPRLLTASSVRGMLTIPPKLSMAKFESTLVAYGSLLIPSKLLFCGLGSSLEALPENTRIVKFQFD